MLTAVLCTFVGSCMGGVGWLIRRGLRKYEAALVAAERARRELMSAEMAQLQEAVLRVSKDQEAVKLFLANWAKKLTGDVGAMLKLTHEEADQLKKVLDDLVNFLGVSSVEPDKTQVKQIGKDLFLVHKPKEEKPK